MRVLLFGPQGAIGPTPGGVEVIDAPVSIAKAPDPALAVRSTPDASIVLATKAVAEGRADALVSGGSTGAALAAGLFHVKRARGIHRPALAIAMPVPGAPVLLLDVGASVEVRPEHLVQFAYMGAAFAQAVLGVERPRVALLSNGEEPGRGTPDVIAAHERLAGAAGGRLNFVGNVEGTSLTEGVADVVVMDGFTGNITLKVMEGVSSKLLRTIRDVAMASPRGRARRPAAARPAARPARRHRSRAGRRRLHARPAPHRRRRPRALHARRLRARDRRRRARRARGRRRPHARRAGGGGRAAPGPVAVRAGG